MAWMRTFALTGEGLPELRLLAEQIVSELFARDYLSEYAAVLNWVRKNIRYSRDPATIEQVKQPHIVLATRTGDCDDLATLIGALVLQLGGKVRFVAGGFRGSPVGGDGQPVLTHVWVEAWDPASRLWVVLDPVPGRDVGSMLDRLVRVHVQPV